MAARINAALSIASCQEMIQRIEEQLSRPISSPDRDNTLLDTITSIASKIQRINVSPGEESAQKRSLASRCEELATDLVMRLSRVNSGNISAAAPKPIAAPMPNMAPARPPLTMIHGGEAIFDTVTQYDSKFDQYYTPATAHLKRSSCTANAGFYAQDMLLIDSKKPIGFQQCLVEGQKLFASVVQTRRTEHLSFEDIIDRFPTLEIEEIDFNKQKELLHFEDTSVSFMDDSKAAITVPLNELFAKVLEDNKSRAAILTGRGESYAIGILTTKTGYKFCFADSHGNTDLTKHHGAYFLTFDSLEKLATFISLRCPSNPVTREMGQGYNTYNFIAVKLKEIPAMPLAALPPPLPFDFIPPPFAVGGFGPLPLPMLPPRAFAFPPAPFAVGGPKLPEPPFMAAAVGHGAAPRTQNFTVIYKVPFGCSLYIRGEGAKELSWDKGTALIPTEYDDQWIIQVTVDPGTEIKYKLLLNDNPRWWEEGEDRILGASTDEITPNFNRADVTAAEEEALTAMDLHKIKISVHFAPDQGTPYLRGEGAEGLNWERGQPLLYEGENLWSFEIYPQDLSQVRFKVLRDDIDWEKGDNHIIPSGADATEVTPAF